MPVASCSPILMWTWKCGRPGGCSSPGLPSQEPDGGATGPRAVGRRKKLLLTDMDSTMIGQECIDELADHVGVKPHVAAITDRAMRGEIDFEPALRARVALLKGLPAAVVDDVIRNRIRLTPG